MSNPVKASVTFATSINAPLAVVRAAISDPSWNKWVPFLGAAEYQSETAGSRRICTMTAPGTEMDGYQLRETIEENNKDAGRFIYTLQNPPLPVENFLGTVEANEDGKGNVVASWTATFEATPDVLEQAQLTLIQMYQGALTGLEAYAQKQKVV